MNPECKQGKHRNCDGSGWDHEHDCPAMCTCTCHDETGRAE